MRDIDITSIDQCLFYPDGANESILRLFRLIRYFLFLSISGKNIHRYIRPIRIKKYRDTFDNFVKFFQRQTGDLIVVNLPFTFVVNTLNINGTVDAIFRLQEHCYAACVSVWHKNAIPIIEPLIFRILKETFGNQYFVVKFFDLQKCQEIICDEEKTAFVFCVDCHTCERMTTCSYAKHEKNEHITMV